MARPRLSCRKVLVGTGRAISELETNHLTLYIGPPFSPLRLLGWVSMLN